MALSRFRLRWSRAEWIVAGVIVAACVAMAWYFAVQTLRATRPMGLPLDDSYIYLTYAKQFGRGEPFTYYPGGGYSAGSTSVLWPMLLAPFWTLGARGHALVWVSYILCTVFYALTCVGVWRIVRRIAGDVEGVLAALALVAIAPFAWTSLSGMEVAFASALLVAMILLLFDQAPVGPPARRLGVVLAAASLSRPEATMLVVGIVGAAAIMRVRQRDLRAAAWWCAPLAVPVAWVIANRIFAGTLFPNTGVSKSYFYKPGFDWSFWLEAVWTQTGRMFKGLFWDGASPLVWPRAFAVAWLVGAVRILLWARRERRLLAGVVIVAAPFAMIGAVIASSGAWDFHNYRYIAPAFPLLVIGVGAAFVVPEFRDGGTQYAWRGASVIAVVAFAVSGAPSVKTNALVFAQGAMDTNTQVVAIGRYLDAKLPDASVMFHDAGAIAYYGDGRVFDMVGLITNHQAVNELHGPGSRFEFLEGLPPEQRPTHFAYYPGWLIGTPELYGDVLLHTPIRPQIASPRFVGEGNMQLLVANYDHLGTGERPLTAFPGWHVADRVDIAHIASERAHGWRGAIGRRKLGDRTARWSFVARHVGPYGLVLDGGRTIRGGTERFTLALDPARPARLVLRTGGNLAVPFDEAQPAAQKLGVFSGELQLGTLDLPRPGGPFVELVLDLPPGVSEIRTEAPGPYRAFHWFALQPD